MKEKKNTKSTTELCPNCDYEVDLPTRLGIYKCPVCGDYIVNCSMCKKKKQNCSTCHLFVLANASNILFYNVLDSSMDLKITVQEGKEIPSLLREFQHLHKLSNNKLISLCKTDYKQIMTTIINQLRINGDSR